MTNYLLDVQPSLVKVLAATTNGDSQRYIFDPLGTHAQQDSVGNWFPTLRDGLGSGRSVMNDALSTDSVQSYSRWVCRFLILRAQLYDDDPTGVGGEESGVGEGKENPYAPGQDLHTEMPHRGLRAGALQRLVDAMGYGMVLLYIGQKLSMVPLTDHTPTKCQRNEEIRARHAQGESLSRLADVFGLSSQRVSQILQGGQK